MSPSPSFPQPESGNRQPYKYITHDQLETDWLGSARRLQQFLDAPADIDEGNSLNARYAPGTLVWVLQSKGRQHSNFNTEAACTSYMLHKKRRDKKHTRAIKNLADGGETSDVIDVTEDASLDEHPEANKSHIGYHSKSEWFQRARVVCDEDPVEEGMTFEQRMQRRVKVRYSRGSTYRVRAFNLVPIIEPSLQTTKPSDEQALPPMVIVTPETHIYRRIARAYTTPEDSFMEIGCDYGITVDKIRKAMEEGGDVPKVWPVENRQEQNTEEVKASCLGVDRSMESIGIANERFPQCIFSLCNVMKPEDLTRLNEVCQQTLKRGAPSVIAIDINGNRDVKGVLECLQVVMNEHWVKQPRLMVVKSRFLYWDLRRMRKY